MSIDRKLRVLADDAIIGLDQLCEGWAEVTTKPGRAIQSSDLKAIDILLVRSITQVNGELLENTAVKFVGSATIGVDHIDTTYLRRKDIAFAYAPGCNANAVVDYVMSMLIMAEESEQNLLQKTVGVVGYGNVGKRLVACLQYFGICTRVFDPLVEVPESIAVESLDELLSCDAISLHVPLTSEGGHPTFHLMDKALLTALPDSLLLINTSRGAVIDNTALQDILEKKKNLSVVLDVWENEPAIKLELLDRVFYATGHIAGYSRAGKYRGSLDVVRAAMQYNGIALTDKIERDGDNMVLASVTNFKSFADYVSVLKQVFNYAEEMSNFRKQFVSSGIKAADVALYFDRYRKSYPLRNELDYRQLIS